jgi:hypothetical protein
VRQGRHLGGRGEWGRDRRPVGVGECYRALRRRVARLSTHCAGCAPLCGYPVGIRRSPGGGIRGSRAGSGPVLVGCGMGPCTPAMLRCADVLQRPAIGRKCL